MAADGEVMAESSASEHILARNEAGDRWSDRDSEGQWLAPGGDVDSEDSGLECSLSKSTQIPLGP